MERETGKMNKGKMARTLRMGFAVLALGLVAARRLLWHRKAQP